jgi:hypothetical protein
MISQEFKRDPISMIIGLMAKSAMKRIFKRINYEEFGGALLLGVKGITVISHGRSRAYAIKNAVRVAKEAVEAEVAVVETVEPTYEEVIPEEEIAEVAEESVEVAIEETAEDDATEEVDVIPEDEADSLVVAGEESEDFEQVTDAVEDVDFEEDTDENEPISDEIFKRFEQDEDDEPVFAEKKAFKIDLSKIDFADDDDYIPAPANSLFENVGELDDSDDDSDDDSHMSFKGFFKKK